VLLLASALIGGFQREITNKVFSFWGHIHVTHVDSDRSIDAKPIDKSSPIFNEIADLDGVDYMDENLKTRSTTGGVHQMYPFIHYPGILSTKSSFDGIICKGVDSTFDWDFIKTYLIDGDIFDEMKSPYNDACVISNIQANRLELEVGDAVIVNFIIDGRQIKKRLRVNGIYDTGLQEYDQKFILVDMALLQNVLEWGSNLVSGFSIFLDDVNDLFHINEYIYIEALPPELYSESVRSKFPGIFEWLDLQKINERVLLIIMLIVAFINLSTVMIILILDRVKMVATLKALGARTRSIMYIFVHVIGRIVIKGFLIGNGIALLLALLQYKFRFITLPQEDYYLSFAPVEFNLMKIVLINLFAFAIILIFMIVPALVVSGVKPVKTLRFN